MKFTLSFLLLFVEYHETKTKQNTHTHIPAFGPRFVLHTIASAAKKKGQISKDAQPTALLLWREGSLYTHLQPRVYGTSSVKSGNSISRSVSAEPWDCTIGPGWPVTFLPWLNMLEKFFFPLLHNPKFKLLCSWGLCQGTEAQVHCLLSNTS